MEDVVRVGTRFIAGIVLYLSRTLGSWCDPSPSRRAEEVTLAGEEQSSRRCREQQTKPTSLLLIKFLIKAVSKLVEQTASGGSSKSKTNRNK